jgi:O-antigen/teichoic acid export membrane protein
VGQFALSLAIAGPIFALANLQLNSLVASDHTGEFTSSIYISLRVTTILLAFFLLLGTIIITPIGQRLSWVLLLVGLTKVAESWSDLLYGFMLQHERVEQMGILQASRGIAILVTIWCVAMLTHDLFSTLVSLLLCQLFMTILVDTYVLCRAPSRPATLTSFRPFQDSWHISGRLLRMAFPMGLVTGLNTLIFNMPRYWISALMGDTAVGVFSALSYAMTGGNMAVGAFGQAAVPRLARFYQTDQRNFRHLLIRLALSALAIGIGGIIATVLAGDVILRTLYNEHFVNYADTFLWIMIGTSVLYLVSMGGCALTAARIFSIQAWITLGTAGVVAVACQFLIPSYGLVGAAIAVMVGFTVKLTWQIITLVSRMSKMKNS